MGSITGPGGATPTPTTTKTSRFSGGGSGFLAKAGAVAQAASIAAPYIQSYLSSNSRSNPQQNDPTQPNDTNNQPSDNSSLREKAESYFYNNSRRQVPHQSMDQLLGSPIDAPPTYASPGTQPLQLSPELLNHLNGGLQTQTPYMDSVMSQIGMGGPQAYGGMNGMAQYPPTTQFRTNQFTTPLALNNADYTSQNFNAYNTPMAQVQALNTTIGVFSGGAALGASPFLGGFGGGLGGGFVGGGLAGGFVGGQVGVPGVVGY